jgi:hypothetical protein
MHSLKERASDGFQKWKPLFPSDVLTDQTIRAPSPVRSRTSASQDPGSFHEKRALLAGEAEPFRVGTAARCRMTAARLDKKPANLPAPDAILSASISDVTRSAEPVSSKVTFRLWISFECAMELLRVRPLR